MFQINQIVEGKVAGLFVILAFRQVGTELGVQVKPVNPADHSDTGEGEFFLPYDAIRPVRVYHLVAINERTGHMTRLTEYPMTHAQCCVNKSKFTDHPARRIELIEAA
jgi:hypothetical protein